MKDLAAQNAKLSARLAAKQRDVPQMEQLLEKLAERNDMLEARLLALQPSEDSSPEASPPASPAPAVSPALRRSPRRHAASRRTPVMSPSPKAKPSKRATPDSVDVDEDEAPVKRRLSAQLGTPKTRNKKPALIRDVRKTLVEILGANEMDNKITSGYYLDSKRFFKLGLFEDDTRAIIDYMLLGQNATKRAT